MCFDRGLPVRREAIPEDLKVRWKEDKSGVKPFGPEQAGSDPAFDTLPVLAGLVWAFCGILVIRECLSMSPPWPNGQAGLLRLGTEGLASRAPGFDALWAALYSGGRTPPAYHRSVLSNLAYCRSSSITRRILRSVHEGSSRS